MKNYIKLLIAGTIYSSAVWGQAADSLTVGGMDRMDEPAAYGRGIAYNAKESTAAMAVATSEELSHKTAINASNLLYGLLPGLQVLQNPNNAWNDGASFLIRGMGTTNNRAPLIIVDGFERSLDYLNSTEIESVTLLKDAVSTSLYGVKGANGVILVKTKRGVESGPQIDFSYQFNMGTPRNLPDFVDGYTYAQALNEGLTNDGLAPRYNADELRAFQEGTYPDVYPNVNWMDEALRDHSYGDNVTFSARGGGKYVKYFSQLNFLDDRGILQPTDWNDGYSTQFKYTRLNVRTNLDIEVTPTTRLKLNMFGNFSEHNRPGTQTDDIFGALYRVPSGAFPIKTRGNVFGGTTSYANNPIGYIAGTGYARSQGRVLYADLSMSQDLGALVKGLSASVKFGIDNYATYWDNNTKSFGYESVTLDWATGERRYNTLRNEGNLSFGSSVGSNSNHFNFEARTDYARAWGEDHKLNATLLYAMDKDTQKDRYKTTAFMDVVGQVHYVYKNRYLLDASLSGSASSVLEPGNRWGIFPSVGLGWILSEEQFMKADWLNFLKLRASYGVAGRADYDATGLYMTYYGTGNSYYFKDNPTSVGGMKEAQLGVAGFTYEKSHKANIGLDFMGWNRLSMSIDGYYDHRTDILVDATGSVSTVLGISAPKQNSGVIDSYGVEIAANWNDKLGDFSYNLGAMFSYAGNEIKEMNEEYRPYDYLKRTGRPIGQIFGYEVVGIYQSQEEIDNREVKQYLSTVRPGDLMFKDQNGDNRIDSYDQVPLGYNTSCPEIYYSFHLGAEYKGLGVYALFQGAGHYSKIMNVNSVYWPLINNNTISTHYYENRWTPENPGARYPRLTYAGSDNNYNTNSLWVADASFLKLRTLEVYYDFPQNMLQKVGFLKKAKLFARAHDLFSWNKMDVMDPEAVKASHPLMTQYTFGVNLSF